jgi:hypothetical protein
VVRRHFCRVDGLSGVLPGTAAGRLYLCPCDHAPPGATAAGEAAHRIVARESGFSSDCPQRRAQSRRGLG